MKKGDELPVKVLLEGKPARTIVFGTYAGFSPEANTFAYTTATDKEGVANIRLLSNGPWASVAKQGDMAYPDATVRQEGLRGDPDVPDPVTAFAHTGPEGGHIKNLIILPARRRSRKQPAPSLWRSILLQREARRNKHEVRNHGHSIINRDSLDVPL